VRGTERARVCGRLRRFFALHLTFGSTRWLIAGLFGLRLCASLTPTHHPSRVCRSLGPRPGSGHGDPLIPPDHGVIRGWGSLIDDPDSLWVRTSATGSGGARYQRVAAHCGQVTGDCQGKTVELLCVASLCRLVWSGRLYSLIGSGQSSIAPQVTGL